MSKKAHYQDITGFDYTNEGEESLNMAVDEEMILGRWGGGIGRRERDARAGE